MTWVGIALALVLLTSALRHRRRLGSLAVLRTEPCGAPPEGWRVAAAPGVRVDDGQAAAAAAAACREGCDALELVPGQAPWSLLLTLAQTMPDPREGTTAGVALVAREAVFERARRAADHAGDDPEEAYGALAREILLCARRPGRVLAADLSAPADALPGRRALLAAATGGRPGLVAVFQLGLLAVLAGCVAAAPPAGLVALAALHLEPLLALGGVPGIAPRGLWAALLLRFFTEVYELVAILRVREPPAFDAAEQRAAYAEILPDDPETLFAPRREECPWCGSDELAFHVRAPDLLGKPLSCTLERCARCGLVLQNPPLDDRGLELVYRDFYDGLGEEAMEFGMSREPAVYERRARAVAPFVSSPRLWLDVGGGHGHFCRYAADVWPQARFWLLDRSATVTTAERRGWCAHAVCGSLRDLAGTPDERFDVVSMFHYLEHTRDPRAEIAAARDLLRPGGVLLIEVPDPESRFGRLLGPYWLPWLQGQHLHMPPAAALEGLLRREGFEVLAVQRQEAHQPGDLVSAVLLALFWHLPPIDLPWRPHLPDGRRRLHVLAFLAAAPLVVAAALADRLLARFAERLRLANAYRVLARPGTKRSPTGPENAGAGAPP